MAGFVVRGDGRVRARASARERAPVRAGAGRARGRKSLQPTLFRLEETPARYESMQQFLADSPWDPELLVRGCAERVAARSALSPGWLTTRGPQGREALAGCEAPVLGDARKIGNCQISVSVHAVGARGTLPLGWRCTCPRSGATTRAAAEGEDPRPGRFQNQAANSAAGCSSRRSDGRSRTAPVLADLGLRRRRCVPLGL